MKKNMGSSDRIIRMVIALTIATLYFMEVISGSLAIVFGVIAIIFLLTSLLGFCPLYLPFGIKTCATETERN